MLRNLLMFLTFVVWLSPQPVAANTGIVRGGEHGEFTRLTISTELPIVGVEQRLVGSRRYNLRTTPKIDTLDITRLFERLNAERVESLTETEGALELVLDCDCLPLIKTEIGRMIVIDIVDQYEDPVSSLPLLPIVPGDFPESLATKSFKVKASEPFDLDFAIVDRLSKSIAAQISQNSHVAGFAISGAKADNTGTASQIAKTPSFPDVIEGSPEDICFWPDAVWSLIESSFEKTTAEEGPRSDQAAGSELSLLDDEAARFQTLTIEYLSQGLFDEARNVFLTRDLTLEKAKRFADFVNALNGIDPPLFKRFGQCNPLADLLVATRYNGSDVSNDLKLDMLHSFGQLPVGLQIVLYPRLDWLLTEASEALFPALRLHRDAELALAERKATLADMTDVDAVDPDELAAVTLELRGTDLEAQSWVATFKSYLNHQRYFDALTALESRNPLSDTERADSVAELVDHMVTRADSVTFVQIALANLPDLVPLPSTSDLQQIVERLDAEGFIEEARLFSQAVSMNPAGQMSELLAEPPISRDRPENEDETEIAKNAPLQLDNEEDEIDRLTVARALKQLEAAGMVRKTLTEKFGN